MIWKVIEIHLRRLRHNRVEWLLTFVVPIAFFSIFALIFTRGVGTTPRVKVVLVNGAAETTDAPTVTDRCQEVLDSLGENEGLKVIRGSSDSTTVDRATAESMVRRGTATIAVVIDQKDEQLAAELLNDASDQVASQVVTALVTRAIIMGSAPTPPSVQPPVSTADNRASSPEQPLQSERSQPEHLRPGQIQSRQLQSEQLQSGQLSPQQMQTEQADFAQFVRNVASKPAAGESGASANDGNAILPPSFAPPKIDVVNVIGEGKTNPVISVYAAGIAVMFLLFGATTGGGVLLEERENQTLERLLATHMTMDQLLLGKWFYLTLLGCVQVTVMFVWAQLVFGLNLIEHFDGFAMMTVATASAAASFGLFLATLCRTRGQLGGLSVVAVLTMSALGGSMVPRYVMSEPLQRAGLWTFNAWALDGYDKVFWRELPPGELGPQLAVLMATAFVLLLAARLLAIRWEVT
ncbi:ABC transporter permease [Rhodopirellula sallentina]|uniref:ABC-2 type transporter n=1 Tax=Rhodopirellula sallentina SM41 TaxID=1263870 RepID=M5TRG6_9BACT|nr:ABC transporter permease [Rhodopirellula sallentina]EMI51740.1 ABC-2 type transporter [Rhodopirellula sallentina SM41]